MENSLVYFESVYSEDIHIEDSNGHSDIIKMFVDGYTNDAEDDRCHVVCTVSLRDYKEIVVDWKIDAYRDDSAALEAVNYCISELQRIRAEKILENAANNVVEIFKSINPKSISPVVIQKALSIMHAKGIELDQCEEMLGAIGICLMDTETLEIGECK